jgi:flagellar hook-associated protein 3 FlgL
MRISTNTMFDLGTAAMSRQQSDLLKIQQQIAANRRMLTPADDPIASARALDVTQADAINTQYGTNGKAATGKLATTESALAHAVELVQSVREAAVAAGGGALTAADRATMAQDLQAMRDELLGVANGTDGEGNFLFSGFQTNVQPFGETTTGVQYAGDDGERLVQVGPTRFIPVTESGAEAFMRIRQGNGSFVVSAPATNTGDGTYGPGSVTNPALATGHQYQVVFAVSAAIPPVTTYDVLDVTAGTTVATAQPYTSGGAISFDGIQFEIKGSPANGDSFSIDPSTDQDIFKTISDLQAALVAPMAGTSGRAQLGNSITDALSNLDRALDQISGRRSLVGTRMREVDALISNGEETSVQYKQVLSQLQDLDYAKAISDLMRQQTNLQAAQQSFAKTANLSLFNYL